MIHLEVFLVATKVGFLIILGQLVLRLLASDDPSQDSATSEAAEETVCDD